METASQAQNAFAPGIDRRRFPRHRLSTPVTILLSDGSSARSMTIEISMTGLSACTARELNLGELVGVDPIGGSKASAIVRRKLGTVYGLEFVRLNAEQSRELQQLCNRLPLYYGGSTGI